MTEATLSLGGVKETVGSKNEVTAGLAEQARRES